MSNLTLSQLLEQIVWRTDNAPTVAELSAAAGVHERKFYRAIEGEGTLRIEELRRLAHYMVARHGDLRLAQWMLPEGFTVIRTAVQTDGAISDDVQRAAVELGDCIHAFNERRMPDCVMHADRLTAAASSIRAEAEEQIH